MARLATILFMTRFVGLIFLAYYAFWIYGANNKLETVFKLEKVSLKQQKEALSDLKQINKKIHSNILRSLKSRAEVNMLKSNKKVNSLQADLKERSEVLELSTDLSQEHRESQKYLIASNLKLISFYNTVFNKNKRSLQYNFPDTHTNKLNKILEKYRGLEQHKNTRERFTVDTDKLKVDFLSLNKRKSSALEGLHKEIKRRGTFLGFGLLFLFLVDIVLAVLPHRKLILFLENLKDDKFEGEINIKRSYEWIKISSLVSFLSSKLLTRSKRLDNILDNIKVTVFSVNQKGEIAGQYSKVAEDMFPGFYRYDCFFDFLYATFELPETETQSLINDLFKTTDRKSFELVLASSILPKRIYLKKGGPHQRIVTIDLVDKRNEDGSLIEVLVFCRDKTEEITAKEKLVEDEKRFNRIQRAAVGINDYFEFIKRTTLLMTNIEMIIGRKLEIKLDELLNDIHELKNNFFMADFSECCTLALELEDVFHDNDFTSSILKGQLKFHELDQIFKKQHDDIVKLLHLQAEQKYLNVEWSKLERLQGMIQEEVSPERILQHIKSFKRYPAEEVFNKYQFYVRNLEKECRKEIDLVISPDSCELSYKEVYYLDNVFGLLITNSIDHGIEEAMVRDSRLKPRQGTIKITSRRKGNKLEFILKDDGGGIDEEKLMYKAVQAGYWTEEEAKSKSTEEIIQLLFDKALSSKDEASKTSGRGIGMNSIKRQVESLGGEIIVHSKKGLGTSFIISLPNGVNVDDELDYSAAV
jgi:signal transduction histidine kinase